jgi:hypothetical protein
MSAGWQAPVKARGVSCRWLFWELRSVNRSPRHAGPSSRRRNGARQGARQVWAIVTIGLGLGAGAFGIGHYVTVTREAAAVAAALASAADDEIYTGSILYMPDSGSAAGNSCSTIKTGNSPTTVMSIAIALPIAASTTRPSNGRLPACASSVQASATTDFRTRFLPVRLDICPQCDFR